MKAVLFDGSKDDDTTIGTIRQAIVEQLGRAGWDEEAIDVRNKRIAGCTGCFGCWVKTPGICVIDDDGREIAKKAAQADLLVCLTPITFRGYSSELKRALDRSIPVLLPYFTRVNGEIHHSMRYRRRQRLAVIGVQASPDRESAQIFKTLVDRNAINFHSLAHGSSIIIRGSGPREIGELTNSLLKSIGVTT
ncbi:MAG: flavodoxin family protein [Halobacteriota archaeon]|jgi:multimeric flavodoxin WrbA